MRRTARHLAALLAALLLPCGAVRADAPEQIDRAVRELAAFVRRTLPDREGDTLVVLPLLSDRGGRMLLGERLAGELELALSQAYRRTRVGAAAAGGSRTFTLMGELEPYASRLRVLCRLLGPDGAQLGAARAEMSMSAELSALLVPPAAPDYSGQGLHGLGPEDSLAQDLDPLEPDDAPGAEVHLDGSEGPLERWLSSGDIDRFRFYVALAEPIRLEVHTELDAQLVLYREGERVPFEVRDNPGGAVILFEASLAPGYYIAELLAFSPEVQGPYAMAFSASAAAPDPFEPDDSPEEARPIAPGSSQERTLAAGNPDWVELASAPPGFYVLFTAGLAVDTGLALFRDGLPQVAGDEDGGPQSNAFLGFFLGPGRWLARVEGRPPLAEGRYTLSFQAFSPELILPRRAAREISFADRPVFLQLRVLSAGRHRIRCPGALVELYALPAMRSLPAEAALELAAGDYLLALKGSEGRSASLTVTEE